MANEPEWQFEDGVDAVIARHSSGFRVSLSKRLGKYARVLAGADGLTPPQRARMVLAARRAFEKLHGRPVWQHKRGSGWITTT